MTNREKFRDVFGVIINDDGYGKINCNNFNCTGIACCKDCTFNLNYNLKSSIWDLEYKAPKTYKEGDLVIFKNSLAIYKYDLNGKAVITYLYDDMLINEAVEYKDIKKLGGARNG